MKTIFRLGILGFVALLVAQVLPAQQAPSELHHSPFFARGYNPEPVPTVPVMGIPEVVVHLGYQTYFTVTNVGAAADVRFRFFSAAGEEIEIPLAGTFGRGPRIQRFSQGQPAFRCRGGPAIRCSR